MLRVLNDEELKGIVVDEYNLCEKLSPNSLRNEPYTEEEISTWHFSKHDIRLSKTVATTQFKQDIEGFIEWVELHWISRSTDEVGTFELLMSDLESLKKLIEK